MTESLLVVLGLGALVYLMFRMSRGGGHGGCCGSHGGAHDDHSHMNDSPEKIDTDSENPPKPARRHTGCH